MSDAAEKTAEVVAEGVEEAIDGVVDVVEVVRNNPAVLITVGVVAGLAGGVGGYFIAKKRLQSFYEEVAESEIAQAKDFYARINKVGPDGQVMTPKEVMMERHSLGEAVAATAVREYQGRPDPDPLQPVASEADLIAEAKSVQGSPSDDQLDENQIQKMERALNGAGIHPLVVEEETTVNIFTDPTFDLAEEMKYRTKEKPYIITHDEYFEADKEYDTIQLTYFEQDDTVVGENDQPVDDVDSQIGEDHLVRFGHGSKDRNVVYVRNDTLQTDYEVTKSAGSYLEHLGLGPEPDGFSIKHSAAERRAFRHGDG